MAKHAASPKDLVESLRVVAGRPELAEPVRRLLNEAAWEIERLSSEIEAAKETP